MSGIPTVTVKLDDGTGTFPYDISTFVNLTQPIQIQHGRGNEFGEVQPNTCALTLDNTDGRFTLGSTIIATPSPVFVDNRIQVTYTVGGTVSKRVTVYVQDWPTEWPDGGQTYCAATINGVDWLPRLARRELRSVVEEEILEDSTDAYYTMGEPGGSLTAGDTSGNARPALTLAGTGATVVFGNATGPSTDGLTAAQFAGGKYLSGATPDLNNGGDVSLLLDVFFLSTSTFAGIAEAVTNGGGDPGFGLGLALATTDLAGRLRMNSGAFIDVQGTTPQANDGQTHHGAIRATLSGGTVTVTLFLDGLVVSTNSAAGTLPILSRITAGRAVLTGFITNPFVGTLSHVTVTTGPEVSNARIAAHATAGLTGFNTESSNARIARYASYANIPTADQVLETGKVTAVPHLDCTGMSPTAAMQKVNEAEQGLIFVRGDGKLIFQNRDHRALQVTPDWTITNDDIDPGARFTTDMQQVTNDVTTSRAAGATQRARNTASITKHEQYPASYDGLLVNTDDQALDLANWLVNTHAEPGARLGDVTIDLLTQVQAFQQAWLGLELSDRLQITGLPSQAPVATADLIVEGWTETLTKDSWTATLNTSPFSLVTAFIFNDATYGKFDTGRFGY